MVLDQSQTQGHLPPCQHQQANSTTLVQEDIHLPKCIVSGMELGPTDLNKPIKHVRISSARPIHMRWLLIPEGLCPKNLSGEISMAASLLLKSLSVVASRGQVVSDVLQVLHISQNPIYARLQEMQVVPLLPGPLLQLRH